MSIFVVLSPGRVTHLVGASAFARRPEVVLIERRGSVLVKTGAALVTSVVIVPRFQGMKARMHGSHLGLLLLGRNFPLPLGGHFLP